mmetsp:Transcript_39041/g.101741  ORF Transcript_39041/g.101741 Transcript_39041/m.101741 type:complete len:347 (+) Transcript_39041:54-1094(+)
MVAPAQTPKRVADLSKLGPSPLVVRIPVPKQTGTAQQRNAQVTQYECLVNIVNMLHHYPEERKDAESFIRRSIMEKLRAAELGSDAWESVVNCLGRLPTDWVMQWVSAKTGFTSELLQKAVIWDPMAVHFIFFYMLNAGPGLKLPEECESKQFCFFFCDFVWIHYGKSVFKDVGKSDQTIIADDGEINFGQLAYLLGYDTATSKVKSVQNRRSGKKVEKLDEDVVITDKFFIKDAWSEQNATATNGKANHYNLLQLFDLKKGQSLCEEFKGKKDQLKKVMGLAKAKVEEVEKAAREGAVSDSPELALLKEAQEKAKKRTSEAATKVLAERREQTTKRRRTKVGART